VSEFELLEADYPFTMSRFPFFCEREIWVGWRDGTFPRDTSDYTSLMCMCALSAQHVGNGALFTDEEPLSDTATFAQDYLREATRLVSLDMESAHLVDLIRSCGFLALLGAQNGDAAKVHKYLAYYHGACAQSNFHDESKWPADVGVCEKEVRRRLWWAMYRLEVQTACVLGSLVRCSETQCDVGYPSGPHHPAFIPGREGQFEDWFSGWNATTDLYRVLEHVVSNFRSTRRSTSAMFPESSGTDADLVKEKLAKIQEQLLPQFGAVSSRSTDSGRNRCGFQACNILCTIHLARMITCLTGDNSLTSACRTAHAMMESMDSTPPEYIRATGSPLLQQLAGVGHMLLGVARKNVPSQTDYSMLRSVLVSIITFLARFGEYSKLTAAAQEKLSAQLGDFDRHVQSTRLHLPTVEDDAVCHESSLSELHTSSFALDGNEHDFLYVDLLKDFTWPYGAKSP
jgi:hypothetical protein